MREWSFMNQEIIRKLGALYQDTAEQAFQTAEGQVPAMVVAWYNDDAYALVYSNSGGRDNLLQISGTFIRQASVDAVTIMSDTVHADSQFKKDGTPWAHGEMQKALEERTEDANSIKEGLIVQTYERSGAMSILSTMYQRDYQNGKVAWEESQYTLIDPKVESTETDDGFIVEFMRQQFKEQCLLDRIKEAAELEEQFPDVKELGAKYPTNKKSPEYGSSEAYQYYLENPVIAQTGLLVIAIKHHLGRYINGVFVLSKHPDVLTGFVDSFKQEEKGYSYEMHFVDKPPTYDQLRGED